MREQPECDAQIPGEHGNEILGSLNSGSKQNNHVLSFDDKVALPTTLAALVQQKLGPKNLVDEFTLELKKANMCGHGAPCVL